MAISRSKRLNSEKRARGVGLGKVTIIVVVIITHLGSQSKLAQSTSL